MFLTRRTLLAAAFSSIGTHTEAASSQAVRTPRPPPPGANVRYIMPAAAGDGKGISWTNAASLRQLNEMIAAVGPGGAVCVRADAGPYSPENTRIAISNGGDPGRPVTIIGVYGQLTPLKAVILGSRTPWTVPTDPETVTDVKNWSPGGDVFVLKSGADYLSFKFFDFQNTGQPFHLTAVDHTGVTISDCSAYNFHRFFEHEPGTSHIDTVLRNIAGTGFSKTAIRIRGDSRNVLLESIALNSGRQDGHNFATGVECNETAHDIVMRQVIVSNCHDTHFSQPGSFWNADGFASERGNYNIYREDCTGSGNTDAGFDDKGRNVTNVNCVASDNKVNYKFWGPSTVNISCHALNPRSRGGVGPQMQYYLYGGHAPDILGADVLVRGGVVSDNDTNTHVFVAEAYNSVFRISGAAVTRHAKAAMQSEIEGWGNAFLYSPAMDQMSPNITSAAAVTAAANVNLAHLLKADKPVTWSIGGGRDASSFKVLPDRRAGTLIMTAAPGSTPRQVIVRAIDGHGNKADQTITVDFGATAAIFFKDDFNRADQDLRMSADWRFIDEGGDGSPSDIAIRGGKLAIFNTAYRGAVYVSPDCGFADHYVQATVATIPSYYSGLIACRITSSSDLIGVEFRKNSVALYERTKGEFKQLAFTRIPPNVGDVLRLEVKGDHATVKRNGVVIIGPTATAGTNAAWTWAGILARSLAVNPWIDDYEAGPL